jgi:5-hydroxyisourate hydrolase
VGQLTTHVLDLVRGKPAADLAIDLDVLGSDGSWRPLMQVRTNGDGRTDSPLLAGLAFKVGTYTLTFHVGGYFERLGSAHAEPPFLDLVPVRFTITDAEGRYHVPLLTTPWSYSTYRGS